MVGCDHLHPGCPLRFYTAGWVLCLQIVMRFLWCFCSCSLASLKRNQSCPWPFACYLFAFRTTFINEKVVNWCSNESDVLGVVLITFVFGWLNLSMDSYIETDSVGTTFINGDFWIDDWVNQMFWEWFCYLCFLDGWILSMDNNRHNFDERSPKKMNCFWLWAALVWMFQIKETSLFVVVLKTLRRFCFCFLREFFNWELRIVKSVGRL